MKIRTRTVGIALIGIAVLTYTAYLFEGLQKLQDSRPLTYVKPDVARRFQYTLTDALTEGANVIVLVPLIVGIYCARKPANARRPKGTSEESEDTEQSVGHGKGDDDP